jgi:hypothetical protein
MKKKPRHRNRWEVAGRSGVNMNIPPLCTKELSHCCRRIAYRAGFPRREDHCSVRSTRLYRTAVQATLFLTHIELVVSSTRIALGQSRDGQPVWLVLGSAVKPTQPHHARDRASLPQRARSGSGWHMQPCGRSI